MGKFSVRTKSTWTHTLPRPELTRNKKLQEDGLKVSTFKPSTRDIYLCDDAKKETDRPMISENQQLVTNKPVEFEK